MNHSYWKHSIAIIFLLSFLFVRIVNIHTLTHIDEQPDADDCELCEIISLNNHTDLLAGFNTYQSDEQPNSIVKLKSIAINYSNPLQTISRPAFVYNKPPPSNI